jgi:iron complex outermembrane receptor protein
LTFDLYTIDIVNKIIKSRSLAVENNPEFKKLAFYTNALDTKTSGYDLVLTYRMDNTNLGLAMNHNETEVVEQRQINGEDPISAGLIDNIENNLPKDRIIATVTQDFGDALSLMVRLNNYSETIDERSAQDVIDPITFIDVELSYAVSNNLNVVFGANNVTNAYPNEIDTRASQGMPYPRRSPLGYHGGMTYIRLMYDF